MYYWPKELEQITEIIQIRGQTNFCHDILIFFEMQLHSFNF